MERPIIAPRRLETGIGCDRHSLSSRLARSFLLGRRVELVKEQRDAFDLAGGDGLTWSSSLEIVERRLEPNDGVCGILEKNGQFDEEHLSHALPSDPLVHDVLLEGSK